MERTVFLRRYPKVFSQKFNVFQIPEKHHFCLLQKIIRQALRLSIYLVLFVGMLARKFCRFCVIYANSLILILIQCANNVALIA